MRKHLKEAIFDTLLGGVINFPLNILMLWICSLYGLNVFWTSVVITIFFTFVAITRKVLVRHHFYKQGLK